MQITYFCSIVDCVIEEDGKNYIVRIFVVSRLLFTRYYYYGDEMK
jgi:hypothetical protein